MTTDSLLTNAVSSIQLGFEDYFASSENTKRLLSAVRNIHAGILLFLKWVIKEHTPNKSSILIFKKHSLKIEKNKINLLPIGKITIGRKEIIDNLIIVNKPLTNEQIILLNKLGNIRNDIEHHFSNHPEKLLKEYIVDSFWLLKELRGKYCQISVDDLFGKDNHSCLMSLEDSHRKQVKLSIEKWSTLNLYQIKERMPEKIFDLSPKQYSCEITQSIDIIYSEESEETKNDYRCIISFLSSIECPECKSYLVEPQKSDVDGRLWPKLNCIECSKIFEFKDAIEEHLEKFFAYEIMKAGSKGGLIALGLCPNCHLGCYLNFIDDDKCLYCGNSEEKPDDSNFESNLLVRNVQLYSDYW